MLNVFLDNHILILGVLSITYFVNYFLLKKSGSFDSQTVTDAWFLIQLNRRKRK